MIDSTDLYKEIGTRIKAHRQAKGMTQEELAHLLNVKRSSVLNYENGSQKISIHMAYTICELFNLAPKDLFPQPESRQSIKTELGVYDVSKELADKIKNKIKQLKE